MQVLVHWACAKINASLQQPDDQLKDVLVAKLQSYRGIRYSVIAGHAESVGRKGLATLLLEYETCAADQVSSTVEREGKEKGRCCFLSLSPAFPHTVLMPSKRRIEVGLLHCCWSMRRVLQTRWGFLSAFLRFGVYTI